MAVKMKAIQTALAGMGFDVGPIDGIRGGRTAAAIMAFQAAWKLRADGIVGPQTLARLFPAKANIVPGLAAVQPWFAEAQRLLGVKEDTSRASNPLIIGWGKDIRIAYGDDEIPWCGLFVAHCISSQLPMEPLPANPLGARQWAKFGVKTEPQPGAVMVFWRESMRSGKGHVGFYVSQSEDHYNILGGNQGDAVSVKGVEKARFLEARWPATVSHPIARPVFADKTGAVTDVSEA